MNFEQIMLRVGLDAQAVSTGLNRITSLVQGWAAGIGNHLKGALGGFIGVAALERGLDAIKEKVLSIKRAAGDTGFSTNFIQAAFLLQQQEGEGVEELMKPLTAVSTLAGERGQKGIDLLKELHSNYQKLNTVEERNAYLKSQGIKGWQSLINIMQQTSAEFAAMEEGNFFTKISPSSIAELSTQWSNARGIMEMLKSAGANMISFDLKMLLAPYRAAAVALTPLSGKIQDKGNLRAIWGLDSEEAQKAIDRKEWENQLGKDGLTNEERMTAELEKQKKLTEDLNHLNEKINDRTKLTVGALADRARQIMGDRTPRGLAGIYSITPAMAAALRVQKLEDQAQQAEAYGNQGLAKSLQSRADQLRASNSALKSGDRWPIKEITENIEHMQKSLNIITKQISRIPTPP